MRIKLRHNNYDVACPYKKGVSCSHPRCTRLRGQECFVRKSNIKYQEPMMKAQMTVIIAPRCTNKKEKYLRRIHYGKN